MSKKLKVALAGLGSRGKNSYAPAAEEYPDNMEITAIADIDPAKVEEVARRYHVPAGKCFSSAEEMLTHEKLADVMFITTQDRQHVKHAIPAIEKGYDLLLEKPVSPDLYECQSLLAAARKHGRQIVVCHVLRYTPFYTKLKEILDAGRIGEIVTVMAIENVGWYHQAHSFVRGNWADAEKTSPMILQKCCHDMDLYLWLTGKTCDAVSSFGGTYLFKPEKAPSGCATRCTEGCVVKDQCPFDAEKIYLDNELTGVRKGKTDWPVNVLTLHPAEESVMEAIQSGPYGRCVYHCDNNVVDHQVVNLNMTDGTTISFTMSGLTSTNSRYCKIMGTTGEIIADMSANLITVIPFGQPGEVIDITELTEDLSGHGGGDTRLVKEFLDLVSGEKKLTDKITTIEHSLESHYIALAAEESRLDNGKVISIATCRG